MVVRVLEREEHGARDARAEELAVVLPAVRDEVLEDGAAACRSLKQLAIMDV